MSDGYYWKLKVQRKGHDPNQPRVPAGQSGGGRWTSTGSTRSVEIATRDALAEALDYGNRTGKEMSISLDENGQEIARDVAGRYDTGAMTHNVSLTPAPVVIHNHPKNVPPSIDDMALMFKHQGIQDMYTVTPDGSFYRISRTGRTPKNEWPGRVEQEYYKVDDRLPSMREIIRDMETTLGRRVTLNEASFKKQDMVMKELADVMGLDYEKGKL